MTYDIVLRNPDGGNLDIDLGGMNAWILVSGVWKQVTDAYVLVSGAWKQVIRTDVLVSGAWKESDGGI